MGPLLRLNRATDVAFGSICVDQSLAFRIQDDHPWDTTTVSTTQTIGHFFSVGHPVGIDLHVDEIASQQLRNVGGPEELLESSAPTSPGSPEMHQHLATILFRLLECSCKDLFGILRS